MKLIHVLIYTGICYFAEEGDPENNTPWSSEKSGIKKAVEVSDTSSSFIQERRCFAESHEDSEELSSSAQTTTPTSYEENVTAASKRPRKKKKSKRDKKKKMRQVKVRPRGGRHIKNTYQDLHSVQYVTDDQPPPPVTKETVVTLEPIYDKENSYSQEELLKLCVETRRIGEKFGIRDVSSFAGSNCALIRLYYPDVTCEQINVFLQYCQTTGSIL